MENLIETIVEFTKVKDIEIKGIYTNVQATFYNFQDCKISTIDCNVLDIDGENQRVEVTYSYPMACGCCWGNDSEWICLEDLEEESLQAIIDDLEKELDNV